MSRPSPLSPRRSIHLAPAWLALGILAPFGMVAVCALMLFQMRQDAWDKAEQTSRNLVQVINQEIDRNIEIIDLSLQGVSDNLTWSDLEEVNPRYLQRILFERAVTAKDLSAMLVLDEHGNSLYDAKGWPARRVNNADRDYFKAHKADPGLGLHISRPLISRLTGQPIMVLSRRIGWSDGTFRGVVLGSLSLRYFTRLFERIELGRSGTINLFLHDGTRIMRYPEPDPGLASNFADTANFRRLLREGRGSFVGVTRSDDIERLYTFTQVGSLPLILNVALSTREIEAAWRVKALVISAVVLGLSLLVGWELRRRTAAEAELAHLSRTDPLTALPNRRAFEEVFERTFAAMRRRSAPIALLVIDADYFKRYNDRYGHAGGDLVLKALAQALSASLSGPGDLAARIGGEEFAVLLLGTDPEGVAEVAERVHEAVGALVVEAEGRDVGRISVSIGLAYGLPSAGDTPADLFRLADAALYEAKAAGRDRTCYAVMGETVMGESGRQAA